MLDWANPDAVYLTYGKIWFPVFVAFTLCAFVVRRRRQPVGFEKWAWRIALAGYVLACVGVFCDYWTQWDTYNAVLRRGVPDHPPGLLLTLLGSTVLGIALLRRGFVPRSSAWLLALTLPAGLRHPAGHVDGQRRAAGDVRVRHRGKATGPGVGGREHDSVRDATGALRLTPGMYARPWRR